jgi:hypothetical protein
VNEFRLTLSKFLRYFICGPVNHCIGWHSTLCHPESGGKGRHSFAGGGRMRLSWTFQFTLCLFTLLIAGVSAAQDTDFGAGPQYLITNGNAKFLRPIATPSMSLDAPLPGIPTLTQIGSAVAQQPYIPDPVLDRQPDLFPIYYGYPEIPVVELSGNAPREVPASINDTGYVAITNAESLAERGYGVSLADDASFWKTHKRLPARVYTNADIRR